VRRIRKVGFSPVGALLSMVGALVMLVVWPPLYAAAAGNGCSFADHWYAQSQSGCCAYGTGIETTTPAHVSVNRSANSSTDEGVWVLDNYNNGIGIEAGYYSGYFEYNNTWTNSLVSYMTLNVGNCCGATGGAIAANSNIFMDDWAINYIGGSCGPEGADVGINHFRFCYDEPAGVNFAQGEVTESTSTWMGGGSGEAFTAYYSNDHSNWYLWGYINACHNSPYWVNVSSGHTYSNGGY
jgi:hypothetical protein